jgi:hypothetical protein
VGAVIPQQYRVYATNNTYRGIPDIGRLSGLARRYCAAYFRTEDPRLINLQESAFFKMYCDSRSEGGVCGGMVCEWAFQYLQTRDPVLEFSPIEAVLLQGDAAMTGFKRTAMDKRDPNGTARTKMYSSKGLQLSPLLDSHPFPDMTFRYKEVTANIIAKIGQMDATPMLMSIEVQGGRHAIGLLGHGGSYYLLEPNQGLFKFDSVEVFFRELNNYFIRHVQKNSTCSLWSIRPSAH